MVRILFLLTLYVEPALCHLTPLEVLLFQTGVDLADGDPSCAHFAGRPNPFPPSFENMIQFDINTAIRLPIVVSQLGSLSAAIADRQTALLFESARRWY